MRKKEEIGIGPFSSSSFGNRPSVASCTMFSTSWASVIVVLQEKMEFNDGPPTYSILCFYTALGQAKSGSPFFMLPTNLFFSPSIFNS